MGKSGKERMRGRETWGGKILWDYASRATRMGHSIAPPIVPPTLVAVAAKLALFPHPLPFAAQLEPSRGSLASSAYTSPSPTANGAFNRHLGSPPPLRFIHDPSHRKSSASSILNCC